ncbi:MAG: hypothetical protein QXL82_02930 [Candidatus Aenigmatarchaeota archaeon]
MESEKKPIVERIRELKLAGHSIDNIITILKGEGYSSEEIELGIQEILTKKDIEEKPKEIKPLISISKEEKPRFSFKKFYFIPILAIIFVGITFSIFYFNLFKFLMPKKETSPQENIQPISPPQFSYPPTQQPPQPSGGEISQQPPYSTSSPSSTSPYFNSSPKTTSNISSSYCGNYICETGEDNINCPIDCISYTTNETNTTSTFQSVCGNYICEIGEDNINCPIDCQT